jgi:hypothetical protein
MTGTTFVINLAQLLLLLYIYIYIIYLFYFFTSKMNFERFFFEVYLPFRNIFSTSRYFLDKLIILSSKDFLFLHQRESQVYTLVVVFCHSSIRVGWHIKLFSDISDIWSQKTLHFLLRGASLSTHDISFRIFWECTFIFLLLYT